MPPQKTHPLSWCVEKPPAGAPSATHKPADPLNIEATLKLTSLCEKKLFILSHTSLLQNAMDKVYALSSHTYLSCNQIFSIWRKSKCCNCFPKTEKITLRNISNMWLNFNTSWLGNRLGWTEKLLKSLIIVWHNGFALPWGFLAAQLSNRSLQKQKSYKSWGYSLHLYPRCRIMSHCWLKKWSHRFRWRGEKSQIPWSCSKIPSMSWPLAVSLGITMFMR